MKIKILVVLFFLSTSVFALNIQETDKKILLELWEDLQLNRWYEAEKKINKLVKSSSEDIICNAKYAEGNLWQHRRPDQNIKKAQECYSYIVEKYPKNEIASWALLSLGRIPDLDILKPNTEEAIRIYYRVLKEYPDSNAAQEAVLHLSAALLQKDGKEGAIKSVNELENFITKYPNKTYTSQIELLIGKLCRYPIKDYRKSVNHLIRAFDIGITTLSQQIVTCWAIAAISEKELHDRNLAVKYYTLFINKYPRDGTAFMAKQALKRLNAPIPQIEDVTLEGITKKYRKNNE